MAREYGSGSVEKHNGKWRGIISYADGGKRKRLTKAFDIPCEEGSNRGRPAALKALAEWRAELEAQEARARKVARWSDLTVREYCSRYVDAQERGGHIEPSTAYGYRSSLRSFGTFGNIPMRELKPSDVQEWETRMLEDGLSPVTVGRHHRFLKLCAKHAVDVDDVERDPTRGVKPPKRTTQRKNALDAVQRARVAATLAAMEPTGLKAAIALAMYGGLREGECCALRWKNVDLRGNSLRVCESIGRRGGGTYEKTPKNESSDREFPMPSALRGILAERREAMLDECIAAGVMLSGDMRVCGRIDGSPANPTGMSKEWRTLAHSNGFVGVTGKVVTFHDLRHTFATVAIAEGVDVRTVADMLGHADPAMTLRVYAVSDPDAKKRAAAAIDEAFARPLADVVEFRRAAGGE